MAWGFFFSSREKSTLREKKSMIARRVTTTPGKRKLGSATEVDLCAICLDTLDEATKHHLDCKHAFHAECIIKSLRYKSWCPVCRDDPARTDRDDEENDEEEYSETEYTARRMLKKLETETIRSILRDCKEPTVGRRPNLAREAALQLTMSTDDDDSDEEGDETAQRSQGRRERPLVRRVPP